MKLSFAFVSSLVATMAAASSFPTLGNFRSFGQKEFGSVVRLSDDGKRMAVGAPTSAWSVQQQLMEAFDNNNATTLDDDKSLGAVFVYERDESTADQDISKSSWRLIFQVQGELGEALGNGLDLSDDGNILAVRRHDDPTRRDVQVYQYNATIDSFALMERGDILACQEGQSSKGLTLGMTNEIAEEFGGETHWMLVGCETDDNQRGKLQVFRYNKQADSWDIFSSIAGREDGGLFGWDSAFFGPTTKDQLFDNTNLQIAVSSPNMYSNKGLVQVFEVDPLGVSSQLGNDLTGEVEGDLFGFALDMSTDTYRPMLVIGAPQSAGDGISRGAVHVFGYYKISWGADFSWNQVCEQLNGKADNDRFGHAVAITRDSHRIAATSMDHDQERGMVAFYAAEFGVGTVNYHQVGELVGDMPMAHLGYSVTMTEFGSMIASGSIRDVSNDNKNSSGSFQAWLDVSPFCSEPLSQMDDGHLFLARKSCSRAPSTESDCRAVLSNTEKTYCVWMQDLTTSSPSSAPSMQPTISAAPTSSTFAPTSPAPSFSPTMSPTTLVPTSSPTASPTVGPTSSPTFGPTPMLRGGQNGQDVNSQDDDAHDDDSFSGVDSSKGDGKNSGNRGIMKYAMGMSAVLLGLATVAFLYSKFKGNQGNKIDAADDKQVDETNTTGDDNNV